MRMASLLSSIAVNLVAAVTGPPFISSTPSAYQLHISVTRKVNALVRYSGSIDGAWKMWPNRVRRSSNLMFALSDGEVIFLMRKAHSTWRRRRWTKCGAVDNLEGDI